MSNTSMSSCILNIWVKQCINTRLLVKRSESFHGFLYVLLYDLQCLHVLRIQFHSFIYFCTFLFNKSITIGPWVFKFVSQLSYCIIYAASANYSRCRYLNLIHMSCGKNGVCKKVRTHIDRLTGNPFQKK